VVPFPGSFETRLPTVPTKSLDVEDNNHPELSIVSLSQSDKEENSEGQNNFNLPVE